MLFYAQKHGSVVVSRWRVKHSSALARSFHMYLDCIDLKTHDADMCDILLRHEGRA